jgi:rubrerythrin
MTHPWRRRADEVSTNVAQGMPRVLQSEEDRVANPVPAGSDVSSGTYRCTNCDNEIRMESRDHVPPCPSCGNGEWDTVRGGDSVNDPYPDRQA